MATAITKKPMPLSRVSVDFPKQDEVITSPAYTLRVSAPEGLESVEVSIDDGPWQACRPAVGYWWYDWAGYDTGEHEIIMRVQIDGRKVTSEAHEFFVDLKPKPVKP